MRRHFLFLLSIVFLFSKDSAQAIPICSPRDPGASNLKAVVAVKDKIVDEATSDFSRFCQWNRMDRFSMQFSSVIQEQYAALKNENDIDRAAQLLASRANLEDASAVWQLSMAGHPTIKKLAEKRSLLVSCGESGGYVCKSASASELEAAFAKPFKGSHLYIPDYQNIEGRGPTSYLKRTAACLVFSDSSTGRCARALGAVEDLMGVQSYVANDPVPRPFMSKEKNENYPGIGMGSKSMPFKSRMVTAAPVIKKILSDSTATEGLRLAARKLLGRLKSPVPSKANIFDDLKKSFEESGLPSQAAEDKTWETLAAISSGGPNFSGRWSREIGMRMDIKNINDNPNAFAFQLIAESLPKLDTVKTAQGGTPYSLPEGVSFPCDIGKSYHFWMTAFLSRHLAKQGLDSKLATSTAYLANLGYQMNREAYAGSRLDMNQVDYFGAVENGLRMDLVLAASGAKFGIQSAENKRPHFDLVKSFKTAAKAAPRSWTVPSVLASGLPGDFRRPALYTDRIQPLFIYQSVQADP